MAILVSVAEFRAWAGTNVPAQVPDALIAECLDEAEAGIVSEAGSPIDLIAAHPLAGAEATGEEKRRAQNLLAKRNSPEGVAGMGVEGYISIPAIPVGGQRVIWHIRQHLQVDEGVA